MSFQEQLEREMRECQARYTGICPVRERMYAVAFDELIVAVARDECADPRLWTPALPLDGRSACIMDVVVAIE